MARNATKKTSNTNATYLTSLLTGFATTLPFHLLVHYLVLRRAVTVSHLVKLVLTEAIALAVWSQLVATARAGGDLGAPGVTASMLDVVYVTWATHVAAAFGSWGWWLYLVIPAYAGYLAYKKVLLPFVFRGVSPFATLWSLVAGGNGQPGAAQQEQPQQQQTSKRQAKLQARAERGDPRVQARRR